MMEDVAPVGQREFLSQVLIWEFDKDNHKPTETWVQRSIAADEMSVSKGRRTIKERVM